MTSKKELAATKLPVKRRRQPSPLVSAEQKAQAVLAVWTERVKVTDVTRALGVTYMTVQQWQERALEGMLQALEPRANLANGAALSPRLRTLLERRQAAPSEGKLKARLERLQEIATAANPSSSA